MDMTEQTALKVKDCFGPCTSLYECLEIKEIIELAEPHKDLESFLRANISAEDVFAERSGYKIYQEWKTVMKPAVLAALKKEFGFKG